MNIPSHPPTQKFHLARTCFVVVALLSCWFATTGANSAWAFWFGTVPNDGVELKGAASASAPTVQTLSQGTRFSAVDEPTNGYYRIRTKAGTGFIDAALVESQNTQHGGAAAPPTEPTPQAQPRTAQNRQRRSNRKSAEGPKWSVRFLLGSTLSNPSSVSSALGSTSLSDPLGLGLEGESQAEQSMASRLQNRISH